MKKVLFKIIALFYCFSVLINFVKPQSVNAAVNVNDTKIINKENSYITVNLDENKEANIFSHITDKFTNDDVSTKGLTLGTVAVYVGKKLAGYVFTRIIDGIVISATGQSGAEWASQAINAIVGKAATSSVYLSCSIYPPYSQEGALCRQGL